MIRPHLRTFEAEQIGGLNVAYCNEKRSYCARNRGKTLNICEPLRAAQKIASAIHRKTRKDQFTFVIQETTRNSRRKLFRYYARVKKNPHSKTMGKRFSSNSGRYTYGG